MATMACRNRTTCSSPGSVPRYVTEDSGFLLWIGALAATSSPLTHLVLALLYPPLPSSTLLTFTRSSHRHPPVTHLQARDCGISSIVSSLCDGAISFLLAS